MPYLLVLVRIMSCTFIHSFHRRRRFIQTRSWSFFSLSYTFYLWTKAIPQLCQWQLDAAAGRTSCVCSSLLSDILYNSSKHLDICAKTEVRDDCQITDFDKVMCQLHSVCVFYLFILPCTTLKTLWVWKLIWSLLTMCTYFERFLHLLKHLLRRLKGHRFTFGLLTSSAETNTKTFLEITKYK